MHSAEMTSKNGKIAKAADLFDDSQYPNSLESVRSMTFASVSVNQNNDMNKDNNNNVDKLELNGYNLNKMSDNKMYNKNPNRF